MERWLRTCYIIWTFGTTLRHSVASCLLLVAVRLLSQTLHVRNVERQYNDVRKAFCGVV